MGRGWGRALRLIVFGGLAVLAALAFAGSFASAEDNYPPAQPATTTTAPRPVATTSTSTTTTTEAPAAPQVTPTTIAVKGKQAFKAPPEDPVQPAPWVQDLPTVHELSLKAAAPNLGLAFLFMILTALPAMIFNSTFQQHHEVVTRWMAPIRARIAGAQAALAEVPSALVLGGFSLVGALLYAQLEPGFTFDQSSIVLWLALASSIFAVTSILEYSRAWALHRRTGVRCRLETLPLSLVVAGLLVLVSRVADLHPGYVFGIVAGIAVARHIRDEDDGASLAVGYVILLVLAAVAWVAWIPVRDHVTAHSSIRLVFLDSALGSFWVIALEAVLFSLIPMRFLYGQKVFSWNRIVWFVLEGIAAFGFFMLLQNPNRAVDQVQQSSLTTALIVFLTFLGLALFFWAWFRFVHPRRTVLVDAEGRELLT